MQFSLLLFLTAAVFMDHREDRIPNVLCFSGGIAGLILNLYHNGPAGCAGGIAGAVAAGGIPLLCWIFHILGGGDVKLLMMAGCYLNFGSGFMLLRNAAVFSGIQALILMCRRKNLFIRMGIFVSYWKERLETGKKNRYPFSVSCRKDREQAGMHLSYSILAGYLYMVICR